MKKKLDIDENKIEFSLEKTPMKMVKEAEEKLGLHFADDYIELLLKYGRIDYDGHEITGITPSDRVNVIDVTLYERECNPNISGNMYVVEKTNFDGIVIWQDNEGNVYKTINDSHPTQIFESLGDFLDAE